MGCLQSDVFSVLGSEKDIFDEFDTDFTGKLLGMNS